MLGSVRSDRRLAARQTEAHPADRLNTAWASRPVDLLSQVTDVYVDDVIVAEPVRTPDLLPQHLAGVDGLRP
jgi:hypothetical protein